MYKSLLVATDGSDTAATAVRVATELAKRFGATLHIARVYRPEIDGALLMAGATDAFGARGFAEAQTESIAALARAEGVLAYPHVVPGNVAEWIVAIAEEQNVELIVVGNRGMRGLRRVLGSVPNAVAHSAPCAVLIVDTTGAAGGSPATPSPGDGV